MSYGLQQLKKELTRDEGRHLSVYRDTEGYYTIGVGHYLGRDKRMSVITDEECDALFSADIVEAEQTADRHLPGWRDLDPVRQRAILNMCFNLGDRIGGFRRFIAAVARRDWAEAGKEMMMSRWAQQVKARAVRLRAMIETGEEA